MQAYQQAVQTLIQVIGHGKSLDGSFPKACTPLAKQITYGVLRDYYRLQAITTILLDKPLPKKHLDLQILLLCGIYSIDQLHRPVHASVNALVNTTGNLNKRWAKNLVNAVMRNYLRRRPELTAGLEKDQGAVFNNGEVHTNHPGWLAEQIRAAWPAFFDQIIAANNSHPPMTLRINIQKTTQDAYLQLLNDQSIKACAGRLTRSAVILESPVPIDQLPGFHEGLVSVQDEASQLAAEILVTRFNDSVLDACAAPGGKTCHLLETNPSIVMTANDIDDARLQSIKENLNRLDLHCQITHRNLDSIKDLQYDKILFDAPCSATGIIRRHPDIKLLRRKSDIAKLAAEQARLLRSAWDLLVEGGEMLYSTCSILPEENEHVLSIFVAEYSNVEVLPVKLNSGVTLPIGTQLLPLSGSHDGFYYAHLRKAKKT